ncbi:Hypothetical protein yfeW precursor [Heterostelium album PN500]|uniref:Beta-lactamase-related domain-containing protein n=1 Tax=Heterostelium pallidum (strain ATCC 26659 / Pp 5 / PN500) TaxID=670386 RepID=D3BSD4_HETP5|nr:Hypothetical protein yfeW precursor [Heterostelium album PN500]EFA75707.1 Hypothetical protein yfeW precursor [Heterostelium album PN500]|eukprot:XP_020427841.1 Hypothetical protein yfeW precursor [Heterostelium album PN500]
MKVVTIFVILLTLSVILIEANKNQPDASVWDPVTSFLEQAIVNGSFPGCVALVGTRDKILYSSAPGAYTYGVPTPINVPKVPQMEIDTLFDMASCTKVTATTTAIAQFYQRGELSLDSTIASILGQQFAVNGKGPITVLNCLLHNSGFYPDPNPFWNTPEFGCPATAYEYPPLEFSCQTQFYNSIMNQSLMNPIGSTYVYSDLNFMTLMLVVGHYARTLGYVKEYEVLQDCLTGGPGIDQCYYEAYVRKYVFYPLHLKSTNYLPPTYLAPYCAPTENDTVYMHTTIQGVVSDGNAYAMGGIGGHAGVFSNAPDMYQFMHAIMFADKNSDYLNSTTVQLFTTEYNHTQSSRALGWNTNDPTVPDYGWSLACGTLSPKTWMHLGYTGTMLSVFSKIKQQPLTLVVSKVVKFKKTMILKLIIKQQFIKSHHFSINEIPHFLASSP